MNLTFESKAQLMDVCLAVSMYSNECRTEAKFYRKIGNETEAMKWDDRSKGLESFIQLAIPVV